MKILISTGIYPPKIGGPAQYAKNLKDSFEKKGFKVVVKTFGIESKLPTGVRHLYYFFKIIPSILFSTKIIVLDTFSAGFPTVLAAKIFGRRTYIRTGGDFLWERYTERNKKKVLLRNFYNTETGNFSFYEKIVFVVTKFTLNNATKVIFSTDWQRQIFIKAYKLKEDNTEIIENFYGEKSPSHESAQKVFVGSTRKLVWKNIDTLERVFEKAKQNNPEISLFTSELPYEKFIEKMGESYATILVSLGDISPNMVLDSIRLNKPFICTKENGLMDRIGEVGIYVDPLQEAEISNAIEKLLDPKVYQGEVEKIKAFKFTHTWDEIATEFLEIK